MTTANYFIGTIDGLIEVGTRLRNYTTTQVGNVYTLKYYGISIVKYNKLTHTLILIYDEYLKNKEILNKIRIACINNSSFKLDTIIHKTSSGHIINVDKY